MVTWGDGSAITDADGNARPVIEQMAAEEEPTAGSAPTLAEQFQARPEAEREAEPS